MHTMLIIEDDTVLCNVLSGIFSSADYYTIAITNGNKVIDALKYICPDVTILDIMLSTADSYALYRKIKLITPKPIIVVTRKIGTDNLLMGYRLKADDYFTVPFTPEALVKRVDILLDCMNTKSRMPAQQSISTISYNGLLVQKKDRRVLVDGQVIHLGPKQFNILWLLIRNTDLIFTREQLLDAIWYFNYHGNLRLVDTQINGLRNRLQHKASMIQTISGVGYKFSP